jgi:hypothetical protein
VKRVLPLLALAFPLVSNAQDVNTTDIIELGKYYSNFMFRNEAPSATEKELGKGFDQRMAKAVAFIKEGTRTGNELLTPTYLKLPDATTLKIIYMVNALHQNPYKKPVMEKDRLIDSLKTADVPRNELIHEYYSMLFTVVGNKNQPFNMGKVNFKMKDYDLNSDEERAIFYLECMELCGSQIFGYMNIVKPPNTAKALEYIKKFPSFDGLKYYQYTELHFKDFKLVLNNDQPAESYADYYLDKLYNTLLSHLLCLEDGKKDEEKINDLLLGSILKDASLYEHTRNKATLEKIFQKQ